LNIHLLDNRLTEEFLDFYNYVLQKIDLTDNNEEILLKLKGIFRKREQFYKTLNAVSRQEAMGLFGELTFLKELLTNSEDYNFVINSWRRPDRSTHDFDCDKIGYEIKTAGLSSKWVKIANENQLDRLNHETLFLVCYLVECFPSNSKNSIEELFIEIANLIKSPILETEILEKIGRDLEDFKFDLTAQFKIFNEVDSEFPKITSEHLNENLSSVSYLLSLTYLEKNGKKSKMAQ
jgi:arsenate reductase-like glutaredoxin family protein